MKAEFIQTCVFDNDLTRFYDTKSPNQKCGIKICKAIVNLGFSCYGTPLTLKNLRNNYYIKTYQFNYNKEKYAVVVHSATDFFFKITK